MSAAAIVDLTVQMPEKAVGVLFAPNRRYRVLYGGRGSAKSWSIVRALLLRAYQRPTRVLCTRELQVSMADSVHKLLVEQIEALGLGWFFDVTKTSITGRNGSEFLFTGLFANVTKIKSMEGVDVAWVEEAEKVSAESWKVLIPTIRKAGSEIWVSFNPDLESDPTYQRFVVNPPPDCIAAEMNADDNPWFPETLAAEREYLYRVDPEAAAHVWGGQCRRNSNAQVLRGRWRIERFEPAPEWDGPYFGADWGFAADPTALVAVYVAGRTLYVRHEAYGVGVDLDDTPALFDRVPGAKARVIRADSARPETISHMQRHGYPLCQPAEKGPGSVEHGVEHLRSYEAVVIHPDCRHAADEARLWSFKTDRLTGDVLPDLAPKHDHIWDAVRYALEPIARASHGAASVGRVRGMPNASW